MSGLPSFNAFLNYDFRAPRDNKDANVSSQLVDYLKFQGAWVVGRGRAIVKNW